jgi:hypothetical protein
MLPTCHWSFLIDSAIIDCLETIIHGISNPTCSLVHTIDRYIKLKGTETFASVLSHLSTLHMSFELASPTTVKGGEQAFLVCTMHSSLTTFMVICITSTTAMLGQLVPPTEGYQLGGPLPGGVWYNVMMQSLNASLFLSITMLLLGLELESSICIYLCPQH